MRPAHRFDSLIPQTHSCVALGTWRNMHIDFATNRRNCDRASQNSRRYRNRHRAHDIASRPSEKRIWLNVHVNVQIPVPPAFDSLVSLTGQPDRVAVVDSRRNLHGDRGNAMHLIIRLHITRNTVPLPRHLGQGSVLRVPNPLQWGQVDMDIMIPRLFYHSQKTATPT